MDAFVSTRKTSYVALTYHRVECEGHGLSGILIAHNITVETRSRFNASENKCHELRFDGECLLVNERTRNSQAVVLMQDNIAYAFSPL